MRKFYSLLLTMMLLPVVTFAQEYCTLSGNTSRADNRGITRLEVSDNLGTQVSVAGAGVGRSQALYVDRTTTTQFVTRPGATITVSSVGEGTWMHSYVYVDFNNNKTFDVNEANCHNASVDGDLVCHTGYTGVNGDNPAVASNGASIGNAQTDDYFYGSSYNQTLPAFTLPDNMAAGTYRIRFKIDWNCVDPCGRHRDNGYTGNLINENGGGIIDFTLVVEAPITEYTVNIAPSSAEAGTVEFVSPAGAGNSVTTSEPNVVVKATANLGYEFVNWTDGNGNEVSTEATYTYNYNGETSVTLTANFVAVEVYTVTIEQPVAGGTVSVSANGSELTSGTRVNTGTVLTLSKVSAAGYRFLNYLVNGAPTADTEVTVTSDVTISAAFEEGVEYCEPTGVPGRRNENNVTNWSDPNVATDKRSVSSLTVTDGDNTITVEGCENVMPRAVYYDRSSTVFTTTPGSTVSVTVNVPYQSGWMHTYVYVDKDLNGLEVNDKVWDNDNGGHQPWAVTFEIPVPADMNLGDYRVRYIVDWDQNMGPCYYGQSGSDNGEIVIDFTLRVAVPHVPTINYTVSGGGDVVVADEFTHEGTGGFHVHSVVENGSEIEKEMLLIFVPKQYKGEVNTIAEASINGSDIIGLLVSGSYLDYESKDLPGTSDAACYWMTIPATQTEDQNVYVRFEGAVQGIDGIGMEESKGPAEYYNLQGVRVAADNLVPGFYIVRQGGKATKVFIQK